MKKYIVLILLMVFFTTKNHSQNIGLIKEGKCYMVLNNIREQVDNDSIAVALFKLNYVVAKVDTNYLFKRRPTDIIKYFNLIRNRSSSCILKRFYYDDKVLLE